MSYPMDFSVRTDPSTLESTGFVELLPGRFGGQHWGHGSLFVWEDAFGMAEGIVTRHFPGYDHLGVNEIPREVGTHVIQGWRSVAIALRDLPADEAVEVLETAAVYGDDMTEVLNAQRDDIIMMLELVAAWVERTYKTHDYVAILGV